MKRMQGSLRLRDLARLGEFLDAALAATGGKIHGPRGAADILDINPSTLRSRMEKLGIEAA